MRKQLKGIGVMFMLLMATIAVSAQSGPSSIVSKDVQRVANKKAFENEDKSNIQAQSVPFPAIVVSKGVVGSTDALSEGNITSKGYPTWAISKGVARQNHERILESPSIEERNEGTRRGEEITRK